MDDVPPPWKKARSKLDIAGEEIDIYLRRLVHQSIAASCTEEQSDQAVLSIEQFLKEHPSEFEGMVERFHELESAGQLDINPKRLLRLQLSFYSGYPSETERIVSSLKQLSRPELIELYDFTFPKQIDRYTEAAKSRRLLVLSIFFEGFDVPYEVFWKAWYEGSSSSGRDRYVVENMKDMVELERRVPGGVYYLYRTFGLRNLARCTIDVLEEQAKNKDFTGTCVIILYAQEDRSGALIPPRSLYRNVSKLIRREQPTARMLCFEVGSNRELVEMFIRLEQLYGEKSEGVIQTLIFEGHGAEQRVWLSGSGERKEFFHKYDYATEQFARAFARFKSLFASYAPIYLGYCHSGKNDDSGAQAAANAMDRPVHGAEPSLDPFVGVEAEDPPEGHPHGGIIIRPMTVEGQEFSEFHPNDVKIAGDRSASA